MNFLGRQLENPVRFARICLLRILQFPQKLGGTKRCCYVVLAVIVLAEIVLPRVFPAEHHLSLESWPAFGSIYGLVSCAAIIVISKFLGKVWLMRREDHYDS